jgi:hypothetical protein
MAKETDQDQQLTVRISAERIALLDEIRRREKDLPTRAAMLRRLVDEAALLRNVSAPASKAKVRSRGISRESRQTIALAGSHVRRKTHQVV